MASLRIQFDGIDRLRYLAVRARIRAQAAGFACENDWGEATDHGVTIQWTYQEEDRRLVFICFKRPWWVTELVVGSRIRGLMEAL
jgi:hypothetical protein